MQLFHSFQEVTNCQGAVVALGTFDGVHLGHQKVMRTAIDKAAETGGNGAFFAEIFSTEEICSERFLQCIHE